MGVTTHSQLFRPMSIVIPRGLVAVDPPPTLNFSKRGALMLIATLEMIKLVFALVVQTTELFFALERLVGPFDLVSVCRIRADDKPFL